MIDPNTAFFGKAIRFFCCCLLVLPACRPTPDSSATKELPGYLDLQGRTMGTTYSISCQAGAMQAGLVQAAIDSLLEQINLDVSTYIDSSAISRFNRAGDPFPLADSPGAYSRFLEDGRTGGIPHPHFLANLLGAQALFRKTSGNFDPTVMPLVQYWGFGTEKRAVRSIDSLRVDSLKALVGFGRLKVEIGEPVLLTKSDPGIQLDFSASAKGYAIDRICDWLDARGMAHYFVEIGGEVRSKGLSRRGDPWRAGISNPRIGARPNEFAAVIQLEDAALASSGNYRNFYESEGRIYGHTINPITGYPEMSSLLGVSVLAPDCLTADAFATAFMVMGVDSAYALAMRTDEVEAFFVYGDEKGGMASRYTPAFEKIIRQ